MFSIQNIHFADLLTLPPRAVARTPSYACRYLPIVAVTTCSYIYMLYIYMCRYRCSQNRASLPKVKWQSGGVYYPPPSIAEVKERVQLCFYFPARLPWSVTG